MSFHLSVNAGAHQLPDGTEVFDYDAINEYGDVVRMRINGSHYPKPNRRSAMFYVVTAGELQLTIGTETQNMTTGDIAIAPANAHRELKGNAEFFVVATPAFDPADEE